MLGSRKPLFATAFTPELLTKLSALEKIKKQLGKEFGDDFVGVSVHGSISKGYSVPESDMDYAVIASHPKVKARFEELAKEHELKLCGGVAKYLDEKAQSNESFLFNGLFYGNHDKLLEMQNKVIENISEAGWGRVAESISATMQAQTKTRTRFGLSEEESEKLAVVSSLLRVPPASLDEMKAIMARKKAA